MQTVIWKYRNWRLQHIFAFLGCDTVQNLKLVTLSLSFQILQALALQNWPVIIFKNFAYVLLYSVAYAVLKVVGRVNAL